MSQGTQIELATSPGYLLKEASSTLRVAMEEVLRPLGMTITHYSCLELLAQRPGLSNSELARGAFVTRQSMSVLLQTLQRDGMISRAEQPVVGRTLPAELTDVGRRALAIASAAIRAVEERMLADLGPADRRRLTALLRSCISALGGGDCVSSPADEPSSPAVSA